MAGESKTILDGEKNSECLSSLKLLGRDAAMKCENANCTAVPHLLSIVL